VRATATEETGTGVTVTVILEVTPPAVALTVVEPGLIAVTRPLDVIVAIEAFDVAQVMARLLRGWPCASANAAVSCSVSPTTRVETPPTIVFPGGARISTDATGSGVRIA
jgi:hypothetical protein